jgi:hypothetical protein
VGDGICLQVKERGHDQKAVITMIDKARPGLDYRLGNAATFYPVYRRAQFISIPYFST